MGHIFTVTFPDIGEGVVEGEVIQWLKEIGDPLVQDEPVVIVMTDKATVELPAPYPGKLIRQHYKQGEHARKDKPLYEIELPEEISVPANKSPEEASSQSTESQTRPLKTSAPTKSHSDASKSTHGKALATPLVRDLAKQMGIDINTITGSGKEGQVTKEDLQRNLSEKCKAQSNFIHLEGDTEIPLKGIPGLMAKKMAESKAKIPHFSYFQQADATRLIQLKVNVTRQASEIGVHLTYMPFIIKALSLTIAKYPLLNSSYDATLEKVIIHQQQNIGIAITTAQGLIVAILKGVQNMAIDELVRSYDALIHKAHHNQLLPSDMKGSTITLSNYGVGGSGLWATPIINYPESAILAIAKIHQEPIVKNNQVAIRDMINFSWSFDHRIIDGDYATHLSHDFCHLIQNPACLL